MAKKFFVFAFILLLPLTALAGRDHAFKAAEHAAWFREGKLKAPHAAYIVVEPNCWYCYRMYSEIRPLIASGDLKVRWIVVAFISRTSRDKAAAILGAKDPVAALYHNEHDFNNGVGTGGIEVTKKPSKDAYHKVDRNNEFTDNYEITATPTIIYKTHDGVDKMSEGLMSATRLADLVKHMANHFYK